MGENIDESFNDITKKWKLTIHELNIVKDMINYIVKYFNKEERFWIDQQVSGVREVFRGVAVKSWVAMPVESEDFKKHNKNLIKKSVKFYDEC